MASRRVNRYPALRMSSPSLRLVVFALACLLAACGAASRSASSSGSSEGALEVRALGYETERCHRAESTPLWEALAAAAPDFFLDDSAPTRDCAFFVPDPGLFPEIPGAMFVDLDGDGREEAITEVRSEHGVEGDLHRTRSLVILRSVAGRPTVEVLASEAHPREESDITLEGFGGVRFEDGVLVLAGSVGCYECGCDLVELQYDCRGASCVYLRHRVVSTPEPCGDP